MKLKTLNKGFGAAIAVMLMSGGSLSLSLASLGAALAYSDSVNKRIERVQRSLILEACEDTKRLISAKDIHAHGKMFIEEFDCEINL